MGDEFFSAAAPAEKHPREGEVIRERLLDLDPDRERRFRINCGTGWVGRSLHLKRGKHLVVVPSTAIVIFDPRPLRAAPEGWPDLAGWDSVEVTPEMVGKRLAIFVGEEVKCSGGLRKEQRAFRDCLERMGGTFREVRP